MSIDLSRFDALFKAAQKAMERDPRDWPWRDKRRTSLASLAQIVGDDPTPYDEDADPVARLQNLADPQTILALGSALSALVEEHRAAMLFSAGPHYDLSEERWQELDAWLAAMIDVPAIVERLRIIASAVVVTREDARRPKLFADDVAALEVAASALSRLHEALERADELAMIGTKATHALIATRGPRGLSVTVEEELQLAIAAYREARAPLGSSEEVGR